MSIWRGCEPNRLERPSPPHFNRPGVPYLILLMVPFPWRLMSAIHPERTSVAAHVELALILVRSAKSEPFVEPQGGIGLYHPERDRPAGFRCFFDQAFDCPRPNATSS